MLAKSLLVTACTVIGLALFSPRAEADTVGLHLASVHIPNNDYNNSNPGAYYRMDSGWTAGFYRNSLNRHSNYAGYTWSWYFIDITFGGVTGYQDEIQLLLVPSVAFPQTMGMRLRMVYIPPVEKRLNSHVLHLMAEYQF